MKGRDRLGRKTVTTFVKHLYCSCSKKATAGTDETVSIPFAIKCKDVPKFLRPLVPNWKPRRDWQRYLSDSHLVKDKLVWTFL